MASSSWCAFSLWRTVFVSDTFCVGSARCVPTGATPGVRPASGVRSQMSAPREAYPTPDEAKGVEDGAGESDCESLCGRSWWLLSQVSHRVADTFPTMGCAARSLPVPATGRRARLRRDRWQRLLHRQHGHAGAQDVRREPDAHESMRESTIQAPRERRDAR